MKGIFRILSIESIFLEMNKLKNEYGLFRVLNNLNIISV